MSPRRAHDRDGVGSLGAGERRQVVALRAGCERPAGASPLRHRAVTRRLNTHNTSKTNWPSETTSPSRLGQTGIVFMDVCMYGMNISFLLDSSTIFPVMPSGCVGQWRLLEQGLQLRLLGIFTRFSC